MLVGANLRDACVSNATLSGASLAGADLTGAVLTAADLRAAIFEEDLRGALLAETGLALARFDARTVWPEGLRVQTSDRDNQIVAPDERPAAEAHREPPSAARLDRVERVVDGLVLDLAHERKFRRGELYETREGLCRVGPPLAKDLADFGAIMRSALEPHAKRLAQTLVGKAQARGKAAGRRRTRVTTGA